MRLVEAGWVQINQAAGQSPGPHLRRLQGKRRPRISSVQCWITTQTKNMSDQSHAMSCDPSARLAAGARSSRTITRTIGCPQNDLNVQTNREENGPERA